MEGEREGEEHQRTKETSIGCLSHVPNWGPGQQPRHVPWLGLSLQAGSQSTEPHQPELENSLEQMDFILSSHVSKLLYQIRITICDSPQIMHRTWLKCLFEMQKVLFSMKKGVSGSSQECWLNQVECRRRIKGKGKVCPLFFEHGTSQATVINAYPWGMVLSIPLASQGSQLRHAPQTAKP